jgi:trypsin
MVTRCGGAIVSVSRIITAAHCAFDYQSFIVGVGSNNIATPLLSQTVARINVAIHPSYNPGTLNNDIAVLILSYNLSLGASIATIRLPRRAQAVYNYFAGNTGQIAGWGRINDANTTLSATLRYASINLYTIPVCQSIYGAAIATNTTLCGIGTPDTRSNPCGGDSGGPLAWRDPADNITSIVGIFSFIAQAGCAAGYPSGYTNVASFLDWISVNTGIIIRA